MKTFVNNYGIKIDIPGFYIQCAKFFPTNPQYCVQIIRYKTPDYSEKDILYYTRDKGTIE